MRKILSLILLLTTIAAASAATATIDKVWLEHDRQVNGRTVIYIHTKISSIAGLKGKKPYLGFWMLDKNNKWHPVNGTASSNDGTKYFYSYLDIPYDNTKYDDYSFYIPTNDLNFPSGENRFTFVVTIHDPNGSILAQKSSETFIGIGNSGNNNNNNRNNNNSNNSNRNNNNNNSNRNNNNSSGGKHLVKSWRTELSTGGYVDYEQYSDGSMKARTVTPCMFCHSSGVCGICHGTGGTYNAYTQIYYPCTGCLQSGRCKPCQGTGIHEMVTWVSGDGQNSYAVGKDGTVTIGNGSSGRDRDSDRGSGNKHSGTCPNCGGTGLEKNPMYVNDPSGALANVPGKMLGYTHREGSRCQYCGRWEYHVHLKCYKCR
ncbi:MAG: hypothetical protein K2O00_02030 [Muribaculaceae bacterium]|nr:hypothetical protein [Muribaculaceae bacterium]